MSVSEFELECKCEYEPLLQSGRAGVWQTGSERERVRASVQQVPCAKHSTLYNTYLPVVAICVVAVVSL